MTGLALSAFFGTLTSVTILSLYFHLYIYLVIHSGDSEHVEIDSIGKMGICWVSKLQSFIKWKLC